MISVSSFHSAFLPSQISWYCLSQIEVHFQVIIQAHTETQTLLHATKAHRLTVIA